MADPPLCTLAQLQNGTYSIDDLHLMSEMLMLKSELQEDARAKAGAETESKKKRGNR